MTQRCILGATSRIELEMFPIEVHNEGRPIPDERLPGLFAPMTRGLGAVNSALRPASFRIAP